MSFVKLTLAPIVIGPLQNWRASATCAVGPNAHNLRTRIFGHLPPIITCRAGSLRNELAKWKNPPQASLQGESNPSKEDNSTKLEEEGTSSRTESDPADSLITESSSKTQSDSDKVLEDNKEEKVDVGSPLPGVKVLEEEEEEKVAVGSPLPGVKPSSEGTRLPKAVVEVLRDRVFGFDTFFVTGQEPYEGGILFRGNLRGEPAKSYTKLVTRLQGIFGDEYKLFLLSNPADDRPVSVVVPSKSLEPLPTAVPEWFAAGAFGAVSMFTILQRNAPALTSNADGGLTFEALFGAFATIAVLLAHECGHLFAAKEVGAALAFPYFIPSVQLGSFGGITRIKSILQSRKDLLKIAAAGPLAGASVGLVMVLIGLLLPPLEGQGIVVNASAFHESFLVGGLAKLILGDALQEGAKVSINPLVLSAWAGLLINAINSIPAGELDGGRISQALWGRKTWSRLTAVSLVLLGFAGFLNDVPLYWVILVLFLQRGPIAPQSDEITVPDGNGVALGVAVLLLGLLVYSPFPFLFSEVLPPVVV